MPPEYQSFKLPGHLSTFIVVFVFGVLASTVAGAQEHLGESSETASGQPALTATSLRIKRPLVDSGSGINAYRLFFPVELTATAHFERWQALYKNPTFCAMVLCHGSCGRTSLPCRLRTISGAELLHSQLGACAARSEPGLHAGSPAPGQSCH